ncbi:hypothetical protein [Flavisphingomonas formosensis]|uniref:hypothetical protein n=1 Tax=Flavisphingomonas formosensis TaxID=861534 RepID=UPI0012FC6CAB|nr:hypothetical protein [Sphingomonas formosensis]
MIVPARFASGQVEALFDAVLVNDVVEPNTSLPDSIAFPIDDRLIQDCFALVLQLWRDGIDRREARMLVGRLVRHADLDPAHRVAYKHVRAKFKQLRFACVLYDRRHRCPPLVKAVTTLMGHVQDAFRNRHPMAVRGYALLLRLLLSRPLWALMTWEARVLRPEGAEGFRRYRTAEMRRLAAMLAAPQLTGDAFHAMRKIVSRFVAFIDVLRTLRPGEDVYRLSRFLSAINGLMGAMHDDLVERHTTGALDYHSEPVALPPAIRDRIAALVGRYEEDVATLRH